MQTCLFCGGDGTAPDHLARCDGRQGRRESLDRHVPRLMSGLSAATLATSTAAAISVDDSKDSQRAMVLEAIRATGDVGRTDDELQIALDLDGSSERPRRWELWKLNLITERRDITGAVVKRLTRTNRRAVVWIAR